MPLKSVDTLLDVLQIRHWSRSRWRSRVGHRRVAIALPNGLPAIVSFLAAPTAGTAAPLNPTYPYAKFCFCR